MDFTGRAICSWMNGSGIFRILNKGFHTRVFIRHVAGVAGSSGIESPVGMKKVQMTI